MHKEWSTLTFSKLWTFPWKIFTHLSLGAKGLTSQIRTATEPEPAAEGGRERAALENPPCPGHAPRPLHVPRSQREPAAFPAGSFALARQKQQCVITPRAGTSKPVIPEFSHHLLTGGFALS